jgi:hypothetical protein
MVSGRMLQSTGGLCGEGLIPILVFDSEDVEGWMVEEGIGHIDLSGNFQYGPDWDESLEYSEEEEELK